MFDDKKDLWIAGYKADEDRKLRFGYDNTDDDEEEEDYSDEEWED